MRVTKKQLNRMEQYSLGRYLYFNNVPNYIETVDQLSRGIFPDSIEGIIDGHDFKTPEQLAELIEDLVTELVDIVEAE